MLTVGEFHTLVKNSVNLGNSVDSAILASVRQGVLWIERNYNFRYMHRKEAIFFDPTTGKGPYRTVYTPKKLECMFTQESISDATRLYFIERVDYEDADRVLTERPSTYITDGEGLYFNLGQIPDQIYLGGVWYWTYSTWPSLTTANMYTATDTHWLVTYAEDLLLYQAMVQLSPILRDPEMAAGSKALRDEALRTLLLTEDEYNDSDRSRIMLYRGYAHGRDENA